MIKELVKLADLLDKRGDQEHANLIDDLIKMGNLEEKLNFSRWVEENISEKELEDLKNEVSNIDNVMDSLYSSIDTL